MCKIRNDCEIGIATRNGKSCTSCNKKIKNGDFFFRIQPRQVSDGSRSLCEVCAYLLTTHIDRGLVTGTLKAGECESNKRSCRNCGHKIRKGESVAMVGVRFLGKKIIRYTSFCTVCSYEVRDSIKEYRRGEALSMSDAPLKLNSKFEYTRERARKALS